jgi:hypothetical protein
MRSFVSTSSHPHHLPLVLLATCLCCPQNRASAINAVAGGKSAHDYWTAVTHMRAWNDEFTAAYLAADLQAMVCPGLAMPAFTHGASQDLTPAVSCGFRQCHAAALAAAIVVAPVPAPAAVPVPANAVPRLPSLQPLLLSHPRSSQWIVEAGVTSLYLVLPPPPPPTTHAPIPMPRHNDFQPASLARWRRARYYRPRHGADVR